MLIYLKQKFNMNYFKSDIFSNNLLRGLKSDYNHVISINSMNLNCVWKKISDCLTYHMFSERETGQVSTEGHSCRRKASKNPRYLLEFKILKIITRILL